MHLLPSAADAQILNEGERSPTGGIGSITVVSKAGKVGWRGQVAEQTTKDGERDWRVLDSVVKQAPVPVSSVMGFEVKPEGLLIAAEVCPRRIVDGHVGLRSDEVRLRLIAVEGKHLGHLSVHTVRGVVANIEVFRIEELPHAEVARCVGQHVNGFYRRCVVRCPLNVNLNRHLHGGFNLAGNRVQHVDMPGKDGRALSVQPEVFR